MIVNHRGFEINVFRDNNAIADGVLFLSIFRIHDGYEVESTPYYGAETVREMIGYMKERVDKELEEHPELANDWVFEEDEE